LAQLGRFGLMLVTLAVALFIAAKMVQRHRFNVQLRMARVSAPAWPSSSMAVSVR